MESNQEQMKSDTLLQNNIIVDELELTEKDLEAVAGFAITPTIIIFTTIFQ